MALRHALEIALDRAVEDGEYPDRRAARGAILALLGADGYPSEDDNAHSGAEIDNQGAAPLLAALFRSTMCFIIVVTDLPGKVVAWNEGAARILGWTFKEMEGKSAEIFFTDEDRARGVPHEEMLSALEQGAASDERWHVKKDGTRFWGSGFMMPLIDGRGKAIGFIKIAQEKSPPSV